MPASTTGPHQRAWAEIDLGALERNLGRIRAALPPHIRYVAVVKADAYGHGMPQTAARLMQSGADAFAVANVFEAAELREIGTGWPILVLSPVLPEEDGLLIEHDLMATVSDTAEVARLDAAARRAGRVLTVHLKIDTGMGRVGAWHSRAPAVFAAIAEAGNLALGGLFTHFSSADSDPGYTRYQRRVFLETLERCPGLAGHRVLIHADNSAGLETFSADSPFNAVRVGLLQFGLVPYHESLLARLRVEPVLSFHARLALVKDLPAGTSISYGRTHTLERDSRVALITAGYGDGFPTAASNTAEVLVRGQRAKVLGRITMDQAIIDVTGIPEATVGDVATLIGSQGEETITVEEFSRVSRAIPWESFCSITKRVPRVYRTARPQ